MSNKLKSLTLAISLMIGLSSGTANANWVELDTIDSGYNYSGVFNLNTSDYVSEENIASETLYFSLNTEQTVSFFADNFYFTNKNTTFHQIDLLNQIESTFIAGIGGINGLGDAEPHFSQTLGPGKYQVNYKVLGQEIGFVRPIGKAVQGLGEYNLGLSIAGPVLTTPVPEPETYAMLIAGLVLIGFNVRRRDDSECLI